MNAEFQRIARRDKKAFLRDQCKEIEENNRMEKTKDLFKKIRDTKGMEAVKSGKVDVGVGATNIIGQSVQAGLASPLWSNDLWPNHPCWPHALAPSTAGGGVSTAASLGLLGQWFLSVIVPIFA